MGLFVGIIATIKETRLWVPGLLCGCGCVAVVQLLSRARLFATPWTATRQASLSITSSWSLLMFMSVESVIPSNHLILCRPFLLLPSIFLSIRVFSNESALHIRWPKYWSFNFSIRASNEYSGLILLRINRFDLLAAQRALKSLFQHQFEGNNSPALSLSYGPSLTFIYEYWKNHSFDYIINSQNFIIINKL